MTGGAEAFEALLAAPRGAPVALLHDGRGGPTWLCTDAVASLDVAAGDWRGAFDRVDAFLAEHSERRLVGWLGYDLGLDVEAWPTQIDDDLGAPLVHLTAYDCVRAFDGAVARGAPDVPAACLTMCDVDDSPDLAEKFGATQLPLFVVFRDGVRCDALVGGKATALRQKVQQAIDRG